MIECSSLTPCYDGMHEEYSDSMCTADSRCGAWNITEHYYEGCILAKYCNETGHFEGIDVDFRCPNGEKNTHGRDHFAVLFNLDTLVDNRTSSH